MSQLDFVIIVFNNNLEIDLLKIQAYSYSLVDESFINNIYIVFNDNMELADNFKNKFNTDILDCFPLNIRNKVKLILLSDIGLTFTCSNWFTQQIVKIQISKIITTEYYVIMDAKNHFINKITKENFFKNEKPYLYFNPNGDEMLTFYYNCLNYFNVKCPYKNDNVFKIQTTTPFVFITNECLNLMEYIRVREKKPFDIFFVENMKYTEFFFYYAYLLHTKKDNCYEYNRDIHPGVTVGPQDPKTAYYNTWEYKKDCLDNNKIIIFSLHRHCFSFLDSEYKNHLMEFYKKTYEGEKIISQIQSTLYKSY